MKFLLDNIGVAKSMQPKLSEFQKFTFPESMEFNEMRVRARQIERTHSLILNEKLINTKNDKYKAEYLNKLSELFFYSATLYEYLMSKKVAEIDSKEKEKCQKKKS